MTKSPVWRSNGNIGNTGTKGYGKKYNKKGKICGEKPIKGMNEQIYF